MSKGIISLDNYISKELDYLDIKIDKMDLDSKLALEKYNLLLWKGKNWNEKNESNFFTSFFCIIP